MAVPLPQLEGVEHREVLVDGVRLHVAEAGEGDPVLLQHGWPEHWWEWRELIGALAGRFRVICPDLRGFGWSGFPSDGDWTKERLVDDVIGLLEALEVDRVRYVGHDWGAWMGYLLGLRRPDLVERMVLSSAPPPWRPRGVPDPRVLLRLAYQVPLAAPVPVALKRRAFAAVLRRGRTLGEWSEDELRTYLEPLSQRSQILASTGLYRTFLLKEVGPLVAGRYDRSRLRTPTLLLFGRHDLVYTPQLIDAARARADDLTVEVLEDAGHFVPEECPELFRDRVEAFFGR